MKTLPFSPGSLVPDYFRDSGGDTQELSVPQQESTFREWCVQNSLIPGVEFKDIARPGSSRAPGLPMMRSSLRRERGYCSPILKQFEFYKRS